MLQLKIDVVLVMELLDEFMQSLKNDCFSIKKTCFHIKVCTSIN
jgi:hypothetical protein